MSFFNELKRRNVVRMGLLYIAASWVGLQIADVVFDPLGVPGWVFRLMIILLSIGLPFALLFAWIFELTPEGIKLERNVDRSHSIVTQTGRRMNVVIVALLVLAIGGLLADRLIPRGELPEAGAVDETAVAASSEHSTIAEDESSIAVLPFVNMSGDEENEYFSDGLTEELLNSLVRMGGLKVTGRTSSFAFKGQHQDLREIGQLLNVANVLEGSVRKSGNRVRITAQLIKTSDGYHLWSETFDRELDDIFRIQAEIADQVSRVLHVTLLGDDRPDQPVVVSGSHNAEAYEQYLRGMYMLQHEPDAQQSLESAMGYFDRALELDESYVDPYWGLFSVWNRMNRNGHSVSYNESKERMAYFSGELDKRAPGSEQALAAAGRLANRNHQYEKSVQILQQAVSRYPASSELQAVFSQAQLTQAGLFRVSGDPERMQRALDGALAAIQTAKELDPLSLDVIRMAGVVHLRRGECDELEQIKERALELEPGTPRVRGLLAACLDIFQGETEAALPLARAEPLRFIRETYSAILYDKLGDRESAKRSLDAMMEAHGDSASYQYGQVYAQWGEIETALEWLEKGVEINDAGLTNSGGDPYLDPLKDEPRFQQVLRAVGF